MNEGGILSACDCRCGCETNSYFRWCAPCEVFHTRLIHSQLIVDRYGEVVNN